MRLPPAARVGPVVLAAVAGVSAWLSMGALAITDGATGARVGVLPAWWVLAASIAVFVAVALVARLSTAQTVPVSLTVLVWLPWLPGVVPAAFLIWQGPAEWLVWSAVAIGLAAPAIARAEPVRWLRSPRLAPVLAALIAVVVYLGAAGMLQARLPSGDEPHYLINAESLLRDGDLRIANNHERRDYAEYYPGELRPDFLQRGQDGAIYSIHAPGLSAVVMPAFAAAGYGGALVMVVLLVAAGLALLWVIAWRLTASAAAAWLAWAAVAVTAPMFFHAFTIYPDVPGAACTTVGLWLLVRLEMRERVGTRALVWTGVALAALPWLHTRFAIVAGVMGAAIALRLLRPGGESVGHEAAVRLVTRIRRTAAFLAVPVLAAAAWFGYFWIIWGTPSPAAPYGNYTQTALRQIWPGLPGLLVDQQFGVLTSAPAYVMALVGMVALARRHPRLAVELALVVVPYVLAVASYRMWWGGLAAPARFLVVVLPAAAVPIAVLWDASRGMTMRVLTLALLALSLALLLPRVFVEGGALLYNARDGYDLLLDWSNRSVNLPLAWPSLHRDAPAIAIRDAGIWTLSALVAAGLAWVVTARSRQAWTAVTAAMALTVLVSSTLVWSRHRDRVVTPATSVVDLLERWRPAWHQVGWQSRPWRTITTDAVLGRLELTSSTRGPAAVDTSFLSVPWVPAGEYELVVEGHVRPSGQLSVTVGRSERPLTVWSLDGRPAGLTGVRVVLPVRVPSLTIQGDAAARASISRVTLRPRDKDGGRGEVVAGTARGAAAYGSAHVYFLDDNAFAEAAGFWTAGGAAAKIAIDDAVPDEGSPPIALSLGAGPVDTWVTLQSGAWLQRVTLGAGTTQTVTLPPGGGGFRVLRIDTGTGFRPAQHEAGSTDWRNLGVWVEPQN